MATVKVKFHPSTVAARPGSIIIIVTIHRVVRQITTDYKVFPCEWNEKQSWFVSTVENSRMAAIQSITQRLCWDVERLHGIIERLDRRQRGYSPTMSSRSFNVPARRTASLFSWRMSLSG